MPSHESFWDKIADKYDRRTVKGPNYAARLDRVAGWVGPEARVLDVGCAGGQISIDLAKRVGSVHGIDVGGRLIALARQRAQREGVGGVTFTKIPIEDSMLDGKSYDAITAFAVLHLVDDCAATLARMHEVLRPGGRLIIEVPYIGDWGLPIRALIRGMQLVGKAPPIHFFKQAQFEAMLRDTGFQIEESKVYNPKARQQYLLVRKPGG
ncbi:MAG: class I SAM-dependent methyltransferase [Planctomycetota bacterium]